MVRSLRDDTVEASSYARGSQPRRLSVHSVSHVVSLPSSEYSHRHFRETGHRLESSWLASVDFLLIKLSIPTPFTLSAMRLYSSVSDQTCYNNSSTFLVNLFAPEAQRKGEQTVPDGADYPNPFVWRDSRE